MNKKFIHNKYARALLVVSGAALLQACGGGGGGGGEAAPAPATGSPSPGTGAPAPANEGAVTANFKVGATSRYILVGVGSYGSGRADSATQESNGAFLKLGGNTLSGQTAVKSIQGNESFAMGRWSAGTLTKSSGAETLTGADNKNYHYVVFNSLNELPKEGSFQCSSGAFTTATPDGGAATQTGNTSGNVTLTFKSDGATVAGQLAVAAGGDASVSLNASGLSASSSSMTGSYLSSGPGAMVQVADAGGGAFSVVGAYRAKAGGGNFIGVYRLACK